MTLETILKKLEDEILPDYENDPRLEEIANAILELTRNIPVRHLRNNWNSRTEKALPEGTPIRLDFKTHCDERELGGMVRGYLLSPEFQLQYGQVYRDPVVSVLVGSNWVYLDLVLRTPVNGSSIWFAFQNEVCRWICNHHPEMEIA